MSIADKARKIPGLAAAEGAITGAVATEQDLPQLNPGAWLITALERCHLAWDLSGSARRASKPNADRS